MLDRFENDRAPQLGDFHQQIDGERFMVIGDFYDHVLRNFDEIWRVQSWVLSRKGKRNRATAVRFKVDQSAGRIRRRI